MTVIPIKPRNNIYIKSINTFSIAPPLFLTVVLCLIKGGNTLCLYSISMLDTIQHKYINNKRTVEKFTENSYNLSFFELLSLFFLNHCDKY